MGKHDHWLILFHDRGGYDYVYTPEREYAEDQINELGERVHRVFKIESELKIRRTLVEPTQETGKG